MKFRRSIAQLLLGAFIFVFTYPLITEGFYSRPLSGDNPLVLEDLSNVLWGARTVELYVQTLLLGAAVVASLVVIRKPPPFIREGKMEVKP